MSDLVFCTFMLEWWTMTQELVEQVIHNTLPGQPIPETMIAMHRRVVIERS
jgi:hypothetical protein